MPGAIIGTAEASTSNGTLRCLTTRSSPPSTWELLLNSTETRADRFVRELAELKIPDPSTNSSPR
jgi:hypothetical protein